VPPTPPQQTRSPRGLNAQARRPAGTEKLRDSAPERASQSLRVLSRLAETIISPPGEKAQAVTSPVWPTSVALSVQRAASQILRVVSRPAEVIVQPSGE